MKFLSESAKDNSTKLRGIVEAAVIDSCVNNAMVNAKRGAALIGGCTSEGGAATP